MVCFLRNVGVSTVALTLVLALVGCGSTAPTAGKMGDKMGGKMEDKMGGKMDDKMGGKMEGKVGGKMDDKMGGKMEDKK
jgi:hypothetical protein